MRSSFLIISSLFCLVNLVPQIAHADGNVLLPSSSNANSAASLPNLGIGVPSPSVSGNATTPALPEPATGTQTSTPYAVNPVLQTPASALDQEGLPPKPSAEEIAHLPPGSVPTTVIHQPDMSDIGNQIGKNLPYGLTISISGKSFFGAKDVQTIGDKLGIDRDQISRGCILTLRGLLQTSKGAVPLLGGPTPQINVRYDGSITGYLMMAQAMCGVGNKLPPNSGLLIETGNRYNIPLQQIDCPAPTRQVTKLNVTYDGSGTSQCVYE